MNLDHLRYFLEAARHEHIGRAAKILAVSASTVSHAISALEVELDVSLFEKNGRRIVLTAHGARLRTRAEELLTLATRVRDELASPDREFPEHARIAGTHGALLRALTRAGLAVAAQRNALSFDVSGMRSADVLGAAARGEIDLGVCFSPLAHPNVQSRRLARIPMVLCFRQGHPLLGARGKKPRSVPWGTLNELPCYAAKALQGIENCEHHPALIAQGVTPRVLMIHDSYDGMLEAVVGSDGWSFVPACVVQERRELGMVRPDWNAFADVVCIWPRSKNLSRNLEELSCEAGREIEKLAR